MYHVPVYVTGLIGTWYTWIWFLRTVRPTGAIILIPSSFLITLIRPIAYLMLKMVPVVPQLPSMSLPNCVGEHELRLPCQGPNHLKRSYVFSHSVSLCDMEQKDIKERERERSIGVQFCLDTLQCIIFVSMICSS